MLVSKMKVQNFHKPKLTVDAWDLRHDSNGEMREDFKGKVDINEEDKLMYLGYMLSKSGDNMININHKRNKCIGTEKKILKLINPLG